MRATLRLSSPAWLAQPRITSSSARPVHAREALHERGDRDRREVVGPHGREGAAVAAEGRPDGGADQGVSSWSANGRPPGRRGVKR